ncbi:MAG: hypothetical protein MHPSP_000220 [Paramarteilia canceri]
MKDQYKLINIVLKKLFDLFRAYMKLYTTPKSNRKSLMEMMSSVLGPEKEKDSSMHKFIRRCVSFYLTNNFSSIDSRKQSN